MTKATEPTLEQLKSELEAANRRIKIQERHLVEADAVERLIIAAGLLDIEKFQQARELLNKDS